jgi:uncharacterized protein (DUF1684 family)
VSQELSDAEWLRNMADIAARFQDMRTIGSVGDIARLRSIAAKLERRGVEGEMYMLESGEWRVRMKYAPRERFHQMLGTIHLAEGMPVTVTINPA